MPIDFLGNLKKLLIIWQFMSHNFSILIYYVFLMSDDNVHCCAYFDELLLYGMILYVSRFPYIYYKYPDNVIFPRESYNLRDFYIIAYYSKYLGSFRYYADFISSYRLFMNYCASLYMLLFFIRYSMYVSGISNLVVY